MLLLVMTLMMWLVSLRFELVLGFEVLVLLLLWLVAAEKVENLLS